MARLVSALILVFCYLTGAPHARAEEELPKVDIPVYVDELANGMKIVTIVNHKIPAVNHALWYRVGAVDEPRGKGGMAHFLEHLLFKGTERFPKGELSRIVALSGGNDNAFTMQESTGYYQFVPKEKLEKMMEIEADRMRNVSFSPEDVEIERKVVLEERLMRTDNNPESALWEQIQTALFLRHPYQNPIIGWAEDVKSVTYNDLQLFYRKHYSPANAFIVVAGDVAREESVELATRYYGDLTGARFHAREEMPVEPDVRHVDSRMIVRDPRTDVSSWMRVYRAPAYADEKNAADAYATELLADILGGGEDSPLYAAIVTEKKLATDISAYYSPAGLGYSRFSISATVADGVDPDDLEKAAEEFLSQDPAVWLSEEALEASRSRMLAERIFLSEDVRSLAFVYGKYFSLYGNVDYLQNRDEGLKAVSKDDVGAAFYRIRDESRKVTGLSLPPQPEDKENAK